MNQRDGNVIRGNSLGLEDAFRRFFHEGRDSHGLCFNIAYPWGDGSSASPPSVWPP